MTESNPVLGDSQMTAILLRRLMYPYTQPVSQLVYEWYEEARTHTDAEILDADASCVSLYTAMLPTVQGALEETARGLGQVDALQELIACCLEAERGRPAFDSLPQARRDELLEKAGMKPGGTELSPSANLTLWHLRTRLSVPVWYAQAQRSEA